MHHQWLDVRVSEFLPVSHRTNLCKVGGKCYKLWVLSQILEIVIAFTPALARDKLHSRCYFQVVTRVLYKLWHFHPLFIWLIIIALAEYLIFTICYCQVYQSRSVIVDIDYIAYNDDDDQGLWSWWRVVSEWSWQPGSMTTVCFAEPNDWSWPLSSRFTAIQRYLLTLHCYCLVLYYLAHCLS